jgi:hypothetical protein
MSEQRHCPGCGAPDPAGVACVMCWGRLPDELRRRITDVNAATRVNRRAHASVMAEVRSWFQEHPRARR